MQETDGKNKKGRRRWQSGPLCFLICHCQKLFSLHIVSVAAHQSPESHHRHHNMFVARLRWPLNGLKWSSYSFTSAYTYTHSPVFFLEEDNKENRNGRQLTRKEKWMEIFLRWTSSRSNISHILRLRRTKYFFLFFLGQYSPSFIPSSCGAAVCVQSGLEKVECSILGASSFDIFSDLCHNCEQWRGGGRTRGNVLSRI